MDFKSRATEMPYNTEGKQRFLECAHHQANYQAVHLMLFPALSGCM